MSVVETQPISPCALLRKVDGKRCEKVMSVLGTTPSQLTLMKTLGVSVIELEKAVEDMELQSVETQRKDLDKKVIKDGRRTNSKGMATLGIDPSFFTLQKQLGLSAEELTLALEQTKIAREFPTLLEEDDDETNVYITAAQKNAITKSDKLQKILGTDPKHLRLMRLFGATELEIQETLEYYHNQKLEKPEEDLFF